LLKEKTAQLKDRRRCHIYEARIKSILTHKLSQICSFVAAQLIGLIYLFHFKEKLVVSLKAKEPFGDWLPFWTLDGDDK